MADWQLARDHAKREYLEETGMDPAQYEKYMKAFAAMQLSGSMSYEGSRGLRFLWDELGRLAKLEKKEKS